MVWGFPGGSVVRICLPMQETQEMRGQGSGRSLEKEMAAHSSILAWKIPRTGESGRLQPAESQESDMT